MPKIRATVNRSETWIDEREIEFLLWNQFNELNRDLLFERKFLLTRSLNRNQINNKNRSFVYVFNIFNTTVSIILIFIYTDKFIIRNDKETVEPFSVSRFLLSETFVRECYSRVIYYYII